MWVKPLFVDDDVWTDPDPAGGIVVSGPAWCRPVSVPDRDDEPCLMAVAPPNAPAGRFDCTSCGWDGSMHVTWHGGVAIMSGNIADSLHGRVERPDLVVSEPAWSPTLDDMRTQIATAGAMLAAGTEQNGQPLTEARRAELDALANPPMMAAGMTIVESDAVPVGHVYAVNGYTSEEAAAIFGVGDIVDGNPELGGSSIEPERRDDVGPTDAQLEAHRATVEDSIREQIAAGVVSSPSDVYAAIAAIDAELKVPTKTGRCVNCNQHGHADCGSRARGTKRYQIDQLSKVGGATLTLVPGNPPRPPATPTSSLILPVTRPLEVATFAPVVFKAPVITDRDGEVVPPKLAAKHAMMKDAVKAWCAADPRTVQTDIGPSEIGDPCDARVLRRALGMRGGATPDPWASFVGTAVHIQLARVFEAVNVQLRRERFLLERRVHMTDTMSGSTDLADVIEWTEAVTEGPPGSGVVDIYDHKVLGTDSFRSTKAEKLSPDSKYGVQIDSYALGWRNAGFEVRTVNLALWPRSGFLDGLLIIERKPDYDNAAAAIERVATLVEQAEISKATEYDEPWQDGGTIATTPGKGCGFCPFYAPNLPLGREHCDKGREFMSANKRGTGPRGVTP